MTGQSHFMLIFWLRKVTLRGHINSVKWPPPPQASVPPPLNQRRGGGHTLLQLRGRGRPNSDDWRKSLALCLLCSVYKRNIKSAKCSLLYSMQCTHQLRTMALCGQINSVKSLYAITPTPYHECTQLVQKILWLNWIKVAWWSQQTVYIHGTELVGLHTFMVRLMWPRKVTLRSTKIKVKWLWPVKVTLKVIKRRLKVFCWSCEEGPLK